VGERERTGRWGKWEGEVGGVKGKGRRANFNHKVNLIVDIVNGTWVMILMWL
jgi:hypothetical protein